MGEGIKEIKPLGFPWQTEDPFLFCAYHRDVYPVGNEQLGPKASLAGRNLGHDFQLRDGWRMYHGSTVPGFPAHPHAGFETVTIVTEGLVDHSDSLGAAGRFGNGDAQWMTAGKGVQHAEMFPLLDSLNKNPFELFQIWLNLPKASKKVDPHYKMLWHETIPKHKVSDADGNLVTIRVYAGEVDQNKAPAPNPDSWAANNVNQVAIWLIELAPKALWSMPALGEQVTRNLYFYAGESLLANGQTIEVNSQISTDSRAYISLKNGDAPSYLLLLQGKPIGEPVATYGPFVANTNEELQQLFSEFQRTEFGGWPWERSDQVHGTSKGRFALHADGTEEVK